MATNTDDLNGTFKNTEKKADKIVEEKDTKSEKSDVKVFNFV